MALEKKPNSEPIRGYRLIEPLGAGGFGEVWKCEAPGGIFKAIKFVYGDLGGLGQDSIRAEEELRAVQLIKSIRHPFLLSMDRVENVGGELLIVTELADQNLEELLHKYRGQGKTGVPRGEILGYLREAAEVLDLMNLKFDLQHLDIKPRNLFLVFNHVKVADFGLVNTLSGGGHGDINKLKLGAITPLYAAPELFLNKISRHCDQYSLAIVFQELLTGTLPFNGKNTRQLLLQHTQEEPDLGSLPAEDRPIIARALAKNPDHRFPSCMELVRALLGEKPDQVNPVPALASQTQEQAPARPLTDTLSIIGSDTGKDRPRNLPVLPPGVLPNYIFLELVGNSPLYDLWIVQDPKGQKRLVKFLYGLGTPDKKLKEAVMRLRSLNHPALVPSEVVHLEPGRVILQTDIVEETLRDRFLQCQANKLPGIRRGELVDYLRAAAEVLDYMYLQHGVQHLGLNPRCLSLDNGWLQITDFGLAQVLWHPAGLDIARRNPCYAAPELFEKRITRTCDQVSLALVYAELLTGVPPYRRANAAGQRGKPDLAKLPALDRGVIARALNADPGKRWPSCTEMVLALEGTPPEMDKELREKPDHFTTMIRTPRAGHQAHFHAHSASPGDLHQVIADLITMAGGRVAPPNPDEFPELAADGMSLTHKFQVGLPLGSAKLKLETFPNQCFGRLEREDENGVLILVPLPNNFWGKCLGRRHELEVDIRLSRVNPLSATPIEARACLRAHRCGVKRGRQVLEEMGPGILDNLRQLLLVNSNKRTQERLLWPHPVKVVPILHNGDKDIPVECRGKDLSPNGLGFYLPHELDTPDVLVELAGPGRSPVTIPATLVRANRCADGWYDVGALFRLPTFRSKSTPELCLQK